MSHEEARLIIPVPIETKREAGVMWYEARADPDRRTVSLAAFATKGTKLADAEIQIRPDGPFTTVIWDAGVRLTIDAQVKRDDAGSVHIQGSVNGRRFLISERLDQLERMAQPELGDAERDVLKRWGRLGNSCEALAQATRQSWGPVPCALLYLGVGFSGVACLDGAVAACGAALGGAALAVENCV